MTIHAPLTRIIIFAKTPVPGTVKTRLIPALGKHGAARLAENMLAHTVNEALSAIASNRQLLVELCVAPSMNTDSWLSYAGHPHIELSEQATGDLGDRLFAAAARATGKGERVILIGTDCPPINGELLLHTADALNKKDAVICPTLDGGYTLLGLTRCHRELFANIAWSTNQVTAVTMARLQGLNLSVETLAILRDIDEPDDLKYVPRTLLQEEPTSMQYQ